MNVELPLDYFGVVSSQEFATLLRQDGDKRKRRTAFRSIELLCKRFHVIPKGSKITRIGLVVDPAGQICFQFTWEEEEKPFIAAGAIISVDGKPVCILQNASARGLGSEPKAPEAIHTPDCENPYCTVCHPAEQEPQIGVTS